MYKHFTIDVTDNKCQKGQVKVMTYITLITVGQDIYADMIFLRLSRILTKPRKYRVRKYDFNDQFTKKV